MSLVDTSWHHWRWDILGLILWDNQSLSLWDFRVNRIVINVGHQWEWIWEDVQKKCKGNTQAIPARPKRWEDRTFASDYIDVYLPVLKSDTCGSCLALLILSYPNMGQTSSLLITESFMVYPERSWEFTILRNIFCIYKKTLLSSPFMHLKFQCSMSSWGCASCANLVSHTFFLQMPHWTWCFFVRGLMVVLRTMLSKTMIDWFNYSGGVPLVCWVSNCTYFISKTSI